MIAMQYRIPLPADYDMRIIQRRIAERGHLTDRFPGLAFKAYLHASRDDARPGSQNLYAPFYLWRTNEGMNAFLGGDGFAGVVASFGKPLVETWSVWRGDMAGDLVGARYAVRRKNTIAPHASIAAVRANEERLAQSDLDRGALAAVSAFDPTRWSTVRFSLWSERPDTLPEAETYTVGHVSQPPVSL